MLRKTLVGVIGVAITVSLGACGFVRGPIPQRFSAASTTWVVQATPNPSGARGNAVLDGVSCTSATFCIAVGNYINNVGIEATLAEVWNGTK